MLVFQPQRSPKSLVEGVLGAEAWVDGLGVKASKLNLKREDREGVEGPVIEGPSYCQLGHRNRDRIAYLDHKLLGTNGWLYPGS